MGAIAAAWNRIRRLAARPGGRAPGGRIWLPGAAAILVLGLAAATAAALLWRSSVRARERQSFQTAATDVSGTLEMLLRRDTEFVSTERTLLTMQPNISASEFKEWATRLEGTQHQTGSFGVLVVRRVPAAQLGAFLARRNADPAFRALVGHVEPVVPAARPYYCLLSAGSVPISYSPELAATLQGDWCDPTSPIGGYRQNGTTRAQFTQELTDSGQFAVYLAPTTAATSLIVEAAVYRHGAPIATVAQRRAAVLGWVLGSFEIPTLMRAALSGHRDLAVTLHHHNPGLENELIGETRGARSAHTFVYSTGLSVDGLWTITVVGAAVASGPSANVQALVVFLGGVLASVLLFILVMVLARSRQRALEMVREKTAQLEHQALHDALTGLPNRTLALDRAEQMLARARRGESPVAALYVDLDGFKQVNDTLGHAAGDELLRSVATRLANVVRQSETAGRLGGDEFIVLVDGPTLDAGPERVAERLLESLRQPYELTSGTDRTLNVTASIGIAGGPHESADDLLRDADIALYRAKAQGRNRYVTFHPQMRAVASNGFAVQASHA